MEKENASAFTTTLDGNSDIILDAAMAEEEVARIGDLRLALDGHVSRSTTILF